MKNSKIYTAVIALLLLAGCSSAPKTSSGENKQPEAKPKFEPTFYTGREALSKMYIAARGWQVDSKPYNLVSQPTKEDNGHDGKSGIWGAGFASPTRRAVKVYTWSGLKSDNAPEPGIGARPEDTYNPANTSTQIFDIAFLKIDSDAAFKEAQKHGGEKLIKANPELPVYFLLDWNGRENKLYWHVLYGELRDNPKLRVAVDASTGAFIRVEK